MSIPFRFGVVAATAPSGSAWTDLARRVEHLGYQTLVMPDNVAATFSVFPALAHAALAAPHLHVGTYVLADGLRHPVMVAKEAATLARLTGGRFELGIGAGRPGAQRDFAMLGLAWPSAGLRVSRLEQSLSVIRRLLDGETVTLDGPHFTCREASVLAPGDETETVPFLVAARGPRMLALAAAAADTVALGVAPDASAAQVADLTARAYAAAGDRTLELNVNLMAVGATMPAFLRNRLDPGALAGSVTSIDGDPVAAVEQLVERRRTLGVSYVLVADELMEAFAPVVTRLAGR